MVSAPRFLVRSILVLTLLSGSLALADDEPTGSAPPDPIAEAPIQPEPQPTEDKRVFGVLPNYRTAEDNGVFAPITAHQKLVIATKDTVDYPLFLLGAAYAGLYQFTDSHPNFGQGVAGYSKRYATSYADQASGTYLIEGVLPILFREDPRYFRHGSGHGSILARTFYAATRILVTRTDRGTTSVNFAELVGNGISAGLGNAYYPLERSAAHNLSRWGADLGTDAFAQVLKEIWPDVRQKLFGRKSQPAP